MLQFSPVIETISNNCESFLHKPCTLKEWRCNTAAVFLQWRICWTQNIWQDLVEPPAAAFEPETRGTRRVHSSSFQYYTMYMTKCCNWARKIRTLSGTLTTSHCFKLFLPFSSLLLKRGKSVSLEESLLESYPPDNRETLSVKDLSLNSWVILSKLKIWIIKHK